MSETPVFLTPNSRRRSRGRRGKSSPNCGRRSSHNTPGRRFRPGWRFRTKRPPLFLQVDFGICVPIRKTPTQLTPRLIELQGFPSLYAFQPYLLKCLREAFPAVPAEFDAVFFRAGRKPIFRTAPGNDHRRPRPGKRHPCWRSNRSEQKTRIDFACTETFLGVRAVDVSAVVKRGRQLFYHRDGREIRIERIYNRLIFDELLRRTDLNPAFRLQDDVDVAVGRSSELVFPGQQAFAAIS